MEVQQGELRELLIQGAAEREGERGDIWMRDTVALEETLANREKQGLGLGLGLGLELELEKAHTQRGEESRERGQEPVGRGREHQQEGVQGGKERCARYLAQGLGTRERPVEQHTHEVETQEGGEDPQEEDLWEGIDLEELHNITMQAGDLPFPERCGAKREFYKNTLHCSERELAYIDGHIPLWGEGGPPPKHIDIPPPGNPQNGRVHAAILKLQAMGVVKETSPADIHCTARAFIKDEGTPQKPKERFITDCHILNPALRKIPFTMEGPAKYRKWLILGAWQVIIDLSNAYYHSKIHPRYVKYFGVVTRDPEGNLHYWVFMATPMGYGLAGLACEQHVVPVTRCLRTNGVLASIYCDDMTVANAKSKLAAYWDGQLARIILTLANLTINYAKSDFTPKQIISRIGFTWDCTTNTFSPTTRRVERIRESLQAVGVEGSMHTCQEWLSAAGRVVSTELAAGYLVRVGARPLQQAGTPGEGETLSSKRVCTPKLAKVARFLLDLFAKPVFAPLVPIMAYTSTTGVTDHSETGYGAGLIQLDGVRDGRMTAGPIQEGYTSEDSSTLREVLGGMPFLLNFGEEIRGKRFGMAQDNQATVYAYKHGSKIEAIQDGVLQFHMHCFYSLKDPSTGIRATPFMFWMPRDSDVLAWADWASKDVNINDYQATRLARDRILKGFGGRDTFGELTLIQDAFGDPGDEIREGMPLYWARHYYASANGRDAFTQRWNIEGRTL